MLGKIEKGINEHCLKFAESLDEDEKNDTIIPLSWSEQFITLGFTLINVNRFLSLASPESPGKLAAEDLESYDLTRERLDSTLGRWAASRRMRWRTGREGAKPNTPVGMMSVDVQLLR